MFADTLASQTMSTMASQSSSQAIDMLRATQLSTLEFTPTQGVSVALGFDTSSSLSQHSGSSLLFSNNTSHMVGSVNGAYSSDMKNTSQEVMNLKLGKRFFKAQKESDHQTETFSKIAARNKARTVKQDKEKQAITEGNVNLTRHYRVGDLPDIQISYSDLIAPISHLCQQNKEFAEIVMD